MKEFQLIFFDNCDTCNQEYPEYQFIFGYLNLCIDCYCKLTNKKQPKVVKSIKTFYKKVNDLGGTIIGEYKGSDIKVNCICSEGHSCNPRPGNINQGYGMCKACAGNDSETSKQNFYKNIETLGGTIIGEYKDKDTPVDCICKEGHSCKPRSVEVAMMIIKQADVALDYAQRLQVKAITNISNIKVNEEDVKKRMDDQVEQRVDKTKLTQISKENKELQGKLDSLLEKIVELETTVEERDKSLQIVRKNIANATYEISVLEEDKRKTQKRMSVIAEELITMKETGISSELYEKKAAELEEVIISFREYKIKYNTVVKKYNTILLKNKDIKIENEKKQEQISLLLEETQKKDKENSLLLARISELEKMIKTEQSEVKTSNILVTKPIVKTQPTTVTKPIVKTQPTTLTKPIVKTPPVTLTKPIVKTPATTIIKPILKTQPATLTKPVVKEENDLPITKAFLEAKTMIALKDICREKSLSGYSIKKQKNELIEWMLTKL